MPSKIYYKDVKRWFLEMNSEPAGLNPVLPDNIRIRRFKGSCDNYRVLNKLVGGDLGWVDRQIMNNLDLEEIISHPKVKIYVIYSGEMQAGFAELDLRTEDEVHLEYFGLAPDFRGKGLGRVFLNWTIAEAWKSKPRKVLLNTCEIDHPGALPIYLKAGFKIAEERIEKQAVIL
jgi:GNAT superfamily N-acetyltransferase